MPIDRETGEARHAQPPLSRTPRIVIILELRAQIGFPLPAAMAVAATAAGPDSTRETPM
jgi:hypothetical protein